MFEVSLVAMIVLIGIGIGVVAFWGQRYDRASWLSTISLSVLLVLIYGVLVAFGFVLYSDNSNRGKHTECEAEGVNNSLVEVRVKNHSEFVSCSEIINAFMEADRQLIRE